MHAFFKTIITTNNTGLSDSPPNNVINITAAKDCDALYDYIQIRKQYGHLFTAEGDTLNRFEQNGVKLNISESVQGTVGPFGLCQYRDGEFIVEIKPSTFMNVRMLHRSIILLTSVMVVEYFNDMKLNILDDEVSLDCGSETKQYGEALKTIEHAFNDNKLHSVSAQLTQLPWFYRCHDFENPQNAIFYTQIIEILGYNNTDIISK